MALTGALCTMGAALGFTNKSLRALVSGVLGGLQHQPDDL
jgi:hypothetical protein